MKKYEKIAEWIRDEVEAGTLSLGDKLPPENELMAQFQVSRQTVRTALSLLRKEGIVEGRRGSGSYITANVHRWKNWEEPRQKRSLPASNTG